MLLVDQLKQINQLKKSARTMLAEMVYTNNRVFKKYIDLCYNKEYEIRPCFKRVALKYTPSDAPVGMNYGTLESIFGKFSTVAFNVSGVEMDKKKSETAMIQMFEILTLEEVDFLKQIMKRKYSGMTLVEWNSLQK